jgi:hypothetical protein
MKLTDQEINTLTKEYVDINKAAYAEIERQRQGVQGLLFQYEQAKPQERARIRQQIELTALTPEAQVQRFRFGTPQEKKMLLQMVGNLPPEAQSGIARDIAQERGIRQYGDIEERISRTTRMSRSNIGNLNIKAADNINVKVEAKGANAEDIAKSVGNGVEDKLLKDDDFLKAFANKIRPKL